MVNSCKYYPTHDYILPISTPLTHAAFVIGCTRITTKTSLLVFYHIVLVLFQFWKKVKMAKNWLKISLKVLNSTTGLGGIAILIYGVLMIKVWQPDEQGSSYHDFTFPWFFHAFLAVGIALCAITCLGHVAANTANFYCLSSYIVIVLLLLIVETAIMADVFLNSNWEKALPKDQSGKFDDFKDFVKSSDYISKGVACLIFLIQGVSVLLATILRTRGTNEVDNYESEDEYVEPRLPLLSRSRSGLWSADPNIV